MSTQSPYQLKTNINIKQMMLNGTSWRGGAEGFRIVWMSIVIFILATLLGPEDFGLVGMTDVFAQFFTVFLAMGFDNAIIQQEEIDERTLSSLFWLNILLGLALTFIGVVLAPFLGWFYDEPRVIIIFSVLSASFLLQSLTVVQRGLLGRQMAFRELAIVEIGATFIASIVALGIALKSGSYWSLVVLQLLKQALLNIGYWYRSKWRPQFVLDLRASMSSLRFSGNLLVFNTLNFLAVRVDVLLIGRLLGPEQLGFYLLANRLIIQPIGRILTVIEQTLFPILASVQKDIGRVRKAYIKVIYLIFAAFTPFIITAVLVASSLIPYQLGAKWAPLVPIFIIWCFGALRRILTSRLGVLYLALGRPDLQWKYQAASTPIVILGLLIGVKWGALGTSISYNIAQLSTSFISLYLAFGLIELSMKEYFSRFTNALLAMIIQIVLGGVISWWLISFDVHPYLLLLIVGLFGTGMYTAVLYKLDPLTRDLWHEGQQWLAQYRLSIRPRS